MNSFIVPSERMKGDIFVVKNWLVTFTLVLAGEALRGEGSEKREEI